MRWLNAIGGGTLSQSITAVIPAQAGRWRDAAAPAEVERSHWVPAFAGMTPWAGPASSATTDTAQLANLLMRVLSHALAVVGQHFDDPAIANPAVPAFLHHARQLAAQRREAGDAAVDLGQVVARDAVGLVA